MTAKHEDVRVKIYKRLLEGTIEAPSLETLALHVASELDMPLDDTVEEVREMSFDGMFNVTDDGVTKVYGVY